MKLRTLLTIVIAMAVTLSLIYILDIITNPDALLNITGATDNSNIKVINTQISTRDVQNVTSSVNTTITDTTSSYSTTGWIVAGAIGAVFLIVLAGSGYYFMFKLLHKTNKILERL